jgi:iron complex outermembrane receptor protein
MGSFAMRGSNGGRAHGPRRRASLLLASVSAVGLASAGLAHAADADAESSSDSDRAAQVQGLTVTGAPQVVATVLTPKQVFDTPQTIRITDAAQLQYLGPIVGGAQGFGLNPGAYVNGYGGTGATKYTIALDGIGQGWGGYNGYTGGASLMVTLDGVPIVDPATGLWSSAAFPALSMFQAQHVTYGPGAAADRWYDNIGGAIEFTPLQPTRTAGGIISATGGSYNERMVDFSFQSGEHNGWAGVLAGSYGAGDDFRVAPDGFASPSDDYVLYGKVVKTLSRGDISWGAYFARGEGFRPQVIPVNPNPQITLNGETAPGTPIAGTLYSQKTSGFYSTLPFVNYEKFDINQLAIAYNKINYDLGGDADIKNVAYYVLENRWHIRMNDVFPIGAANVEEFNNPYTYWFGDKVAFTKSWGFNTFAIGGWVHTEYNTHQAFFNPADGGSRFDPNAHYRSGYFNQIDTALYAQDAIRPIANVLIQPGIRVASFWTSYGDGAPFDFPAAFATFPGNDQGALGNALPPYAHRSYTAPEPSVEASYNRSTG